MARWCLVLTFAFFGFVFSGVFAPVHAEKMAALYTARLPVADQSEKVRNRELSNALSQVLVRASGHKKVLNASTIKARLSDAASFMRLYSYKKLSLEEQRVYKKPLLLKVSFEPNAISDLLKSAGQPIWSDNRPSGAYWILVDDGSRKIAADGQDGEAIEARRAANHRGLPIVLPLMDLEDKGAVSAADISGKFLEPLKKASKRYGTDYVALGTVTEAAGGWSGNWVVDLGNDTMRFTTKGSSSSVAVSKMIDRVADKLSSRLAVVLSGQAQTDYLLVDGLYDLASYAKAQSILKNVSMVKSVNAVAVVDNQVLFELELLSARQYLMDALAVSSNLRRTTLSSDLMMNIPTDAEPMAYQWRK